VLSNFYGICSSIYIDSSNVYLFEIDAYSSPNGSALINFLSLFLYFLFGVLSFVTPKSRFKNDSTSLFFVLFFCEIVLYFNYIISQKPYFSEITRMNYWGSSKLFFLRYILGETSSFIFFGSGLLFFEQKKRMGLMLLIAHLVYNILIGQKFGSIYEGIIFFFIPHLIRFVPEITFKYLLTLLIIFLLGIGAAYVSYSYFNPYGHLEEGETVTKAILYRAFALQSQLPWITMNSLSINDILHFDAGYFWDGMNKFISIYSYVDMSDYDPSMMGRLTNAYPSNYLMWNPIFGFIMVLFCSGVLFFAQKNC